MTCDPCRRTTNVACSFRCATVATTGDFLSGGGGELKRDSGHASHLTGCGTQRRRERWWNGSDVGRLWGESGGGGTIQSRWGEEGGGLVTDSAHQSRGSVKLFSHAETQHFVKFNVFWGFFSFYVQLGDTVSTLMSSSYINIVRCL